MRCPVCGSNNLARIGEGAYCMASLTQEDAPFRSPRTQIGKCLLKAKLGSLAPSEASTVTKDDPLDVAVRLMLQEGVRCLLVTDDSDSPLGVVTEHDLVNRVALENPRLDGGTVADIMTPAPETVSSSHPLAHAFHLMVVHDIRYLPLTDSQGQAKAIVSSQNIIDFIEENCPDPVPA